jgi:hypothetical protein
MVPDVDLLGAVTVGRGGAQQLNLPRRHPGLRGAARVEAAAASSCAGGGDAAWSATWLLDDAAQLLHDNLDRPHRGHRHGRRVLRLARLEVRGPTGKIPYRPSDSRSRARGGPCALGAEAQFYGLVVRPRTRPWSIGASLELYGRMPHGAQPLDRALTRASHFDSGYESDDLPKFVGWRLGRDAARELDPAC